jgi:hypothetical protein
MWVAHRSLKILGACACLIIFASSVWSMSHWSEARGVWDDLCYLRQAHLFQRFGLRGIDTNLALDDDDYMSTKLKEIGYPAWRGAPCHTLMPATNKRVLQYPPGTGFVLAIFPAGFQVVPLNILATSIILLCALAAIHLANTGWRIGAASAFGCAAIYFMINPAKASYSMAPTMVVCALAGLLTVFHFRASSSGSRLLTVSLLGLLVGISVNFRVANLFLSAGYFAFFLVAFFQSRKLDAFLDGMLFGTAFLAGIAPTLWANAVNAGSPLSTTYGASDAVPMDWTFSVVPQYMRDLQGILLILAVTWTAAVFLTSRAGAGRSVALVVAGNLLVGLTYFMTHPLFAPYYTIPLVMLSFWSLLFSYVMQDEPALPARLAQ